VNALLLLHPYSAKPNGSSATFLELQRDLTEAKKVLSIEESTLLQEELAILAQLSCL
jgi:hypothetical protein